MTDGLFSLGVPCGLRLVEEAIDGLLGGVAIEFLEDEDFDEELELDFDFIILISSSFDAGSFNFSSSFTFCTSFSLLC